MNELQIALNNIELAKSQNNIQLLKQVLADSIKKISSYIFRTQYGNANAQTVLNIIQNNISPGILNQLSYNEIQSYISIGLKEAMTMSQPQYQGMFQNNYQQPMMGYQQPMMPQQMQQGLQTNMFTQHNTYHTVSDTSPSVNRYSDAVVNPTPVNNNAVNNQTHGNVNQAVKKSATTWRNKDNDVCLLAKGTYIENGEYCGNSVDIKPYAIIDFTKDESLTYDDMISISLLKLVGSDKEYTKTSEAMRFSQIRKEVTGYFKGGKIKLPEYHHLVNLYLIKYFKTGTYNIMSDIEKIKELISGIEMKSLRTKLNDIITDVLKDASELKTHQTTSDDNSITKVTYDSIKNYIVLHNQELYEALSEHNINKILTIERDSYENIYDLLKSTSVNSFILFSNDGELIEFVAGSDLVNEQKFILNIVRKEKVIC